MTTIKSVTSESDDYIRGLEAAKSSIRLFGLRATEFVLSINHPKGLKRRFKSQANKDFVRGCLDAIASEKKQPTNLGEAK